MTVGAGEEGCVRGVCEAWVISLCEPYSHLRVEIDHARNTGRVIHIHSTDVTASAVMAVV